MQATDQSQAPGLKPQAPRCSGVAMLLVLIAVAMATILSLTFLHAQSTSIGVMQNVQRQSVARGIGESALVMAINYVLSDSNWRFDQTNGVWVSDESFNGGTYSIWGEDGEDTDGDGVISVPAEGDGDLADDDTDVVTLTAIGAYAGVTHTVRAVVTSGVMTGQITLSGPDASYVGENPDDKAGYSVTGVGDVIGDCFADFVIGAPEDDTGGDKAGQVYLILGKASGWATGADLSVADGSFIGEDAGDKAGKSVAGVGDVNGDGFDDFVIGTPDDDTGGNDAGQVYLILGKSSGWAMGTDLSTADASFLGQNTKDKVGQSVAGVGDFNGDGFDDFVIGGADDADIPPKAGTVYLILGKASGWATGMGISTADAWLFGENTKDKSGKSVAGVGDVNGDGFDDYVIGAPENDDGGSKAGQVYLVLGRASGWATGTDLSAADASFIGEDAGDKAGESVAGVGDVNGDGFDDFVIGAPEDETGGNVAGQVYLILGKTLGWAMDTDLSAAAASFIGEDAGDKAG
ncbi:MAG: hypothetical protein V3U29_10130, partial [Phycisphaeraceae bacterium]